MTTGPSHTPLTVNSDLQVHPSALLLSAPEWHSPVHDATMGNLVSKPSKMWEINVLHSYAMVNFFQPVEEVILYVKSSVVL